MRLNDVSWYEFSIPVNMSAYGLPVVFGLVIFTPSAPCVALLAGCALRMCSQKTPAFKVWVPRILAILSLALGMYLLA